MRSALPTQPSPDDSRVRALTCGIALLVLVAAPVRQNWAAEPRDGFPLSPYPMFSARRRRHGRVIHLRAVRADGSPEALSYHLAGTGGFNQVRRQIVERATRHPGGADLLARDVRDRLLERLAGRTGDLTEVQVVRSRFEYDAFFAGRRRPDRVEVLGRATLSGAAGSA